MKVFYCKKKYIKKKKNLLKVNAICFKVYYIYKKNYKIGLNYISGGFFLIDT